MKLMSSLFLFSGTGAAIYLNDALFWAFLMPTIMLAILAILLALCEEKEKL
jgi:hypothetical protein